MAFLIADSSSSYIAPQSGLDYQSETSTVASDIDHDEALDTTDSEFIKYNDLFSIIVNETQIVSPKPTVKKVWFAPELFVPTSEMHCCACKSTNNMKVIAGPLVNLFDGLYVTGSHKRVVLLCNACTVAATVCEFPIEVIAIDFEKDLCYKTRESDENMKTYVFKQFLEARLFVDPYMTLADELF